MYIETDKKKDITISYFDDLMVYITTKLILWQEAPSDNIPCSG